MAGTLTRQIGLWLCLGVLSGAERESEFQKSALYGFRPGVYAGIRMGKTKKAEVIARFGKPKWEGLGEDGSLYMLYEDIGPIKGRAQFVVATKTGRVVMLELIPPDWTLAKVKELFGTGVAVTRWSWASCMENSEGAPVYLDPNGSLEKLEYRGLGMEVQVNGEAVIGIYFNERPLGFDRNPCRR